MSSEKFEDMEEEFDTLSDSLRYKVNEQIPRSSGEQRKKYCREVERQIEDANILLLDMENEVKKAPPVYRNRMMSKVRQNRQEIEKLNREMRQSNSAFGGQDRADLFGDELERGNRGKMIQGVQALERASAGVDRAQKISAETDEIGVNIIDELGTQREALVRTKDKLDETDSGLSKSRKILKTMARRMMTNKLILAVIIIMEIGILGGVVYWKFFS